MITVEMQHSDGSVARNVAECASMNGEGIDARKLAMLFAQALDQHVGDPLHFLSNVLQCLTVRDKLMGTEPWRKRLLSAAANAPL